MSFLKKHPILLTIIFVLVASILISVVIIFADSSRDRTATVYMSVAPQGAEISFSGEETLTNNSTNRLNPGTYTISASLPGYETESRTFTLGPNGSESIILPLLPTNNDFSAYEKNFDDLYDLRFYSSKNPDNSAVSKFLISYDKKATIESVLPLYRYEPVDYYYVFFKTNEDNCERLFCLEIGAHTDSAYSAALRDIASHGYNPSDYEIIRSR